MLPIMGMLKQYTGAEWWAPSPAAGQIKDHRTLRLWRTRSIKAGFGVVWIFLVTVGLCVAAFESMPAHVQVRLIFSNLAWPQPELLNLQAAETERLIDDDHGQLEFIAAASQSIMPKAENLMHKQFMKQNFQMLSTDAQDDQLVLRKRLSISRKTAKGHSAKGPVGAAHKILVQSKQEAGSNLNGMDPSAGTSQAQVLETNYSKSGVQPGSDSKGGQYCKSLTPLISSAKDAEYAHLKPDGNLASSWGLQLNPDSDVKDDHEAEQLMLRVRQNGTLPCHHVRTQRAQILGLPQPQPGENIIRLYAGPVYELVIASIGDDGLPRCAGGDYYETDLSSPRWKSRPPVRDHGNGTYTVTLQMDPRFTGRYNFTVILLFANFHGLNQDPSAFARMEEMGSYEIDFLIFDSTAASVESTSCQKAPGLNPELPSSRSSELSTNSRAPDLHLELPSSRSSEISTISYAPDDHPELPSSLGSSKSSLSSQDPDNHPQLPSSRSSESSTTSRVALGPHPEQLPVCGRQDFKRKQWSGRWTRENATEDCEYDDDGRWQCMPADLQCQKPWCHGPVGRLESNGWAYSAHCAFKIFQEDEAWKCLDGRWLFFWGDSNHVDTIRNLLNFVLGFNHSIPAISRRMDATFFSPPHNRSSVRITSMFNGHSNASRNHQGLFSLHDQLYAEQLRAFFTGETAPDFMVMNSGLHDAIFWENAEKFVEDGVDFAANFWGGVWSSMRARRPDVLYRTTVATAGTARNKWYNPQKMEVFNHLMVDRFRKMELERFQLIDGFDYTFPWHYDHKSSDGQHYGRPPSKTAWPGDNVGHRYFVDLMLVHMLLNAICTERPRLN